jgi:hypothetical protein
VEIPFSWEIVFNELDESSFGGSCCKRTHAIAGLLSTAHWHYFFLLLVFTLVAAGGYLQILAILAIDLALPSRLRP